MKKFFTCVVLFLFSFNAFCISEYNVKNAASLKNSSVKIETDWDFYWGRFVSPLDDALPDLTVSVPSSWNKYELEPQALKYAKKGKGAGTYRLRLTGLIPGRKYAVPAFELGYTAFTLLAGEKIIFQAGIPSEDWEKTVAQQYYEPAVFECEEDGSVLITMYVSNNFYRKGGLRHDFTLSEEVFYQNSFNRKLCYYGIFSGILLTIVVYCFLLLF